MGLSCGVSTLKYVLFVFNVLCSLLSIGIIAIATIALVESSGLENVTGGSEIAPIVLLVVGISSLLIAFFGCCGAIRDSICLLNTYATLLMLLLLCKIALAAIVLTNMDSIQLDLRREFGRLWDRRATETVFWDNTQRAFTCCGLNSPADWQPLHVLPTPLPASCCAPDTENSICLITGAFPRGCLSVVQELVDTHGHILAYIALGAAGIELLGFIFSCILVNGVRNVERRSRY